MLLDRNINKDGKGKYLLLNQRKQEVEESCKGQENEFFVIKLKDKYAEEALLAYANAAEKDDPEWANEVREMASRAGKNSPWCKAPD